MPLHGRFVIIFPCIIVLPVSVPHQCPSVQYSDVIRHERLPPRVVFIIDRDSKFQRPAAVALIGTTVLNTTSREFVGMPRAILPAGGEICKNVVHTLND